MNNYPDAVLITGASGRIGLALAKESLSLGFHVIIHFRSTPEPANGELGKDPRVTFLQGDLTDSPGDLMERAFSLPLRLIGLVNNASVFDEGNLSDPGHLERTLAVNVLAPVKLSQSFAASARSGWIINITDAHIRKPNRRYQNYRLSKTILEEITRQQAFLYAPDIRVNAIAPGAILPATGSGDEQFRSLIEGIPLRRAGSPDKIIQTFRFLVQNDYVTGATIPVDGGWHLA